MALSRHSRSVRQEAGMSQDAARNPLVLILEDEAIIALNLQDELQDNGYRVGGPFTSCADA